MAAWEITNAEGRFVELVEAALRLGPQMITQDGEEIAVVVSIEEWEMLQPIPQKPLVEPGIGTLADILLNSPLAGSGIEIERIKGKWRDADL